MKETVGGVAIACAAGAPSASSPPIGGEGGVARKYEPTKPARFVVETVDGVEQIRIRARRNWLVIAFLLFWLSMWTMGGGATIFALIAHFEPFMLLWLGGWAVAWLFVAATIAWQLTGAETLRVVGSDLEIGHGIAGLARRRLFRGSDISGMAAEGAGDPFSRMYSAYPPFLNRARTGSVKFSYGARTIHAAAGLDEGEGRLIVEHLRRRLPLSAVAP